jgi:WD40 repeat protein
MTAALLLAALPAADPAPLTPEVPAVARPTHSPRQVFDLSPDGKTALTGMQLEQYDQYLRLRDVETGAVVDDLPLGTADVVTSAKFAPDGKTVAVALGPHAGPHHVRLLDVRGGRAVRELRGFNGTVRVRGFSPDGTKLVTLDHPPVGRDGAFKPRLDTWDVATGKRVATADAPPDAPLSATTPDGAVTLTRADDGGFVVTRAGEKPVALRADNGGVNYFGAFLTPDGKRAVLSTHAWGTVYDTATGEPVRSLRTDTQQVTSIASADGGKLLFVGVAAGRYSDRRLEPAAGWVYVWDLAKPELRAVIPGGDGVWRAQPTPDGKRVVVLAGSRYGAAKVEVRDVPAGNRRQAFDLPAGRAGWAAVSPDGARVAHAPAGGEKGAVRVWDADTGKPAGGPLDPGAAVVGLAFTPDSRRLATLTAAGYAEWDLAAGKKAAGWGAADPDGRNGWGGKVAPLPGGKGVVVASPTAKRRQSYVLSLRTEKKDWGLGEFWDHVSDPAVSADGRRLAVVTGGSRDGSRLMLLRLTADGAPELTDKPDRHLGPVLDGGKVPAWRSWEVDPHTGCAAFSPDGRLLYTGGLSHAVRVWDVETGALRATLYAVPGALPTDPPKDWVAFTPAGHFAATPGGERVLRFRDATAETWFGLRRPAAPVPAADLPRLRDPAKVREALGAK